MFGGFEQPPPTVFEYSHRVRLASRKDRVILRVASGMRSQRAFRGNLPSAPNSLGIQVVEADLRPGFELISGEYQF